LKSISQIINAAKKAATSKNYDYAIEILDQDFDPKQANAEYWLLKARFAQLGNGERYKLDEIGSFLEKAAEMEPNNAKILTDCGFFFSRVLHRPESAKEYFSKALKLLRDSYSTAIIGMSELDPDHENSNIEAEIRCLRNCITRQL
jgi:tetratricopeptide (TPR) repeat protein